MKYLVSWSRYSFRPTQNIKTHECTAAIDRECGWCTARNTHGVTWLPVAIKFVCYQAPVWRVFNGIWERGWDSRPPPIPLRDHSAMVQPSPPLSSNPGSGTISRTKVVSKQAPRLTTSKTATFWHHGLQRRARSRRVLTAGDRILHAKKREQHRHDYRDALREAQGKIYALAQGLRDRFGKYSVEHYHNDLIHRAHKSRSTQKVNRWNAFQKQELKRLKGLWVMQFT